MWWCHIYGGSLFTLGFVLMLVAAAAAVVEAFLIAKARVEAARQARAGVQSPRALVADGVDPVKFFESLKGLLQALKDLPTWIALFGAGLALVFMAGLKVEVCPAQSANGTDRDPSGTNTIAANTTKTG